MHVTDRTLCIRLQCCAIASNVITKYEGEL